MTSAADILKFTDTQIVERMVEWNDAPVYELLSEELSRRYPTNHPISHIALVAHDFTVSCQLASHMLTELGDIHAVYNIHTLKRPQWPDDVVREEDRQTQGTGSGRGNIRKLLLEPWLNNP